MRMKINQLMKCDNNAQNSHYRTNLVLRISLNGTVSTNFEKISNYIGLFMYLTSEKGSVKSLQLINYSLKVIGEVMIGFGCLVSVQS